MHCALLKMLFVCTLHFLLPQARGRVDWISLAAGEKALGVRKEGQIAFTCQSRSIPALCVHRGKSVILPYAHLSRGTAGVVGGEGFWQDCVRFSYRPIRSFHADIWCCTCGSGANAINLHNARHKQISIALEKYNKPLMIQVPSSKWHALNVRLQL